MYLSFRIRDGSKVRQGAGFGKALNASTPFFCSGFGYRMLQAAAHNNKCIASKLETPKTCTDQ